MNKLEAQAAASHEDHKTMIGFWIYLMTDCVLFASLFATYAVLHNNTVDGLTARDIFNGGSVLAETLVLLVSSFACGLGFVAAKQGKRRHALYWLGLTGLLGLTFLGIELSEFHHIIAEGYNWTSSGFLSAFFTLVATHGLHITVGLLWLAVVAWNIFSTGLQRTSLRRLGLFAMFWHFLDLVWIFIFSVVYLSGRIGL